MDHTLAVVFDFWRGKTMFRLFEGGVDTIRLQTEKNLSVAEFFESRGITPERVREAFPNHVTSTGELDWIMPSDLTELSRSRPDLQKLANMLGLPISVLRWSRSEFPVEEFRLEPRMCR
jgi:hypothetical protein